MAEVSIGIEEMADLVRDLESARDEAPGYVNAIRGRLEGVWLSTESVDPLGYGKPVWGWLDERIMDVHRRLSMARLIAQSSPGAGLTTVTFDDSVLSDLSQAQVDELADRAAELMTGLEIGDRRDVDQDLLDLLAEHAHDPYFAQALAERVPVDQLDTYLRALNDYRQYEARGPDEARAFDERYDAVLNGLGLAFGLASQGTGELEVPGLTSSWTSYIRDTAPHHTGAANRLSLVIGRGQWSTDFLVDVYDTIREAEDDLQGKDTWAVAGFDFVFDPDPERSPETTIVQDPLAGVFTAMATNPDAVFRIFGSGDRESVEVDGRDFGSVNAELFRIIRHRGLDEVTVESLMAALQGGITSAPVEGQTAWQPVLAEDLERLAEALEEEARIAEENRGPWWSRLGHGLLDIAGMVPLFGEVADGINGLWYLAEGNKLDAGLSFAGMIPVAGWFSVGGKWVRRALNAEELATLGRMADNGDILRHLPNGRLPTSLDELADPDNFRPTAFLSPGELRRFRDREWLQRIIAGNRFDGYMVGRYKFDQVNLVGPDGRYYRLDSWSPGEAIVSRKLTQLNDIQFETAKGYIDEFVTKYPRGATVADTPLNRQRGIAGMELNGRMVLEVPPQTGGRIPDEVAEYAFENNIRIIDVNGVDYTAHLFDDVP